MKHSVLELKSRLKGKVDGSSLSGGKVYNTIVEALINMKTHIPLEGSRREAKLINPLFSSIHEYVLPSDFDELIDIRSKETGKSLIMKYETSAHTRNNREESLYNIRTRNGVNFLDFNYNGTTSKVKLYEFDDLTSVSATSINNLTLEHRNTIEGTGIKFDLPLGEKIATFVLTGPKEMGNVTQDGSVFMNVYIPSIEAKKYIDSFQMQITDGTVTQDIITHITQSANEFEKGWNLIRFQLDENQGTLDLSNIDSFTMTINYNSINDTLDSDITGIIVDNVFGHSGEEVYIEYYGNYIFDNADYGLIPRPKSDDDYIRLTDSEFNILTYETGLILAQENQGASSAKSILEFEKRLYGGTIGGRKMMGLYPSHNAKHPHEQKVKNSRSYNVPRVSKRAGYRVRR